jgi:hypothetical protein
MVTYGGMSRKPVCVPTGRLIFNDVSLRGFWLSRWTETHGKAERRAMIKDLMVRHTQSARGCAFSPSLVPCCMASYLLTAACGSSRVSCLLCPSRSVLTGSDS